MVGHDRPGLKRVELAMFRQQRLLNQLRHARLAQPALSVATVQLCLQLATAFGFIGHFEERLPFRSTCYWKKHQPGLPSSLVSPRARRSAAGNRARASRGSQAFGPQRLASNATSAWLRSVGANRGCPDDQVDLATVMATAERA